MHFRFWHVTLRVVFIVILGLSFVALTRVALEGIEVQPRWAFGVVLIFVGYACALLCAELYAYLQRAHLEDKLFEWAERLFRRSKRVTYFSYKDPKGTTSITGMVWLIEEDTADPKRPSFDTCEMAHRAKYGLIIDGLTIGKRVQYTITSEGIEGDGESTFVSNKDAYMILTVLRTQGRSVALATAAA